MTIRKEVPNVYGGHALLDEAARPFAEVPGCLVVSEYQQFPDWHFTLLRQDGTLRQAILTAEGRMQTDGVLITVIRKGLAEMLGGA